MKQYAMGGFTTKEKEYIRNDVQVTNEINQMYHNLYMTIPEYLKRINTKRNYLFNKYVAKEICEIYYLDQLCRLHDKECKILNEKIEYDRRCKK